jgi:hypothetical protein
MPRTTAVAAVLAIWAICLVAAQSAGASGFFAPLGGPVTPSREKPTATPLPDGRVLVAGGFDSSGPCPARKSSTPRPKASARTVSAR